MGISKIRSINAEKRFNTRQAILKALEKSGEEFGKLKAELGLSKPTLSKYLDTLEKEGLVVCEVSKDDKRKRMYMLTETADKVLQIQNFMEFLGGEFGAMAGVHREQFGVISGKILMEPWEIDDRSFKEYLLVLGAGIVYLLAQIRRTIVPTTELMKVLGALPPTPMGRNQPLFSSDPRKKTEQSEAYERFTHYQELQERCDEALKAGFEELVLGVLGSCAIDYVPEEVHTKISRIKIDLPCRARKNLTKYYMRLFGLNSSNPRIKLIHHFYRDVYKSKNLEELFHALMKISNPKYDRMPLEELARQ